MDSMRHDKKTIILRICLLLALLLIVTSCTPTIPKEPPKNMEQGEKEGVEQETIEEVEEKEEMIDQENKDEEVDSPAVEIDYQQIQPNEIGHIMVVMYHGIMDNPPYHRTEEDFWKDLKYMYDHNYRPISIQDYVKQNITIEAGYTPIVLTFDDGLPSTFSLIEENGELKADPHCAVGIMERFSETYPDFKARATFYINGHDPFEGAGSVKDRFEYLIERGYDISNHTDTHADLASLNAEEIQKEIGKVDAMIKGILTDYSMDTFSYPFGKRPKEELRKWIGAGSYEGHEYTYQMAFREGPSGPFVPPIHTQFEFYNVPRVRGSEGAEGDLWWYFDFYEKNPKQRYISDGNPNRIAVPEGKESNIQVEALQGKEIYTY